MSDLFLCPFFKPSECGWLCELRQKAREAEENGVNLVPERTCRADYRGGGYGIGGWYCSECGGYMHDDMQQDMAYCPNCGAKVME